MRGILFSLIFFVFAASALRAQLVFPSDKSSEYTTKVLMASSVKTDTANTGYISVPQRVRDVILYARVDSASASDSLKIEAYQSADASNWVLTDTMPAITSISTNKLLIQNCGKYLRLKYYVQGASSAFKFSLKLVPK